MLKKNKWKVELLFRGKVSPSIRQYVKKVSLHVLKKSENLSRHDETPRVLSVLLTNDGEIKILNKKFRGKNKPTDVLSFSQLENKRSAKVGNALGDLVISLETASRQAKEYGFTLKEELRRLIIHGILHLLGYDHERVSVKEARLMRKLEREIEEGLKSKAMSKK